MACKTGKCHLSGGGTRRKQRQRRQYHRPTSMAQVKAQAKRCDSNWFDKGSMRFFHTRLPGAKKVYTTKKGGCTLFVTSDQRESHTPRLFSVRKQCGCRISTVGKFQGYKTSAAAHKAAARKARGLK